MERSGFFNAIIQNGTPDRSYSAENFARYFGTFIGNGVFPNPSTQCQVIANDDMTVTIKAGRAWINGYMYENTDDYIVALDVADGLLNRIDRVVLKLDFLNREIKSYVKKGTFASSPIAPALQRDADAYELGIADIYIAAGATSIVQANITDQRQNQNYCGIVDSLITADTATLFNQFTDGFNTWFEGIKNTLGSDAAGNLLKKINDLAGDGRTTETVKGVSDALNTHLAEKATQTTLGHVKAGKNVTIQTDGTLNVDVDTMIKFNRNPTSNDINYDTGQLWFNEDTGSIYVLLKIDKDGNAIWRGVNNTELIYPLKIYGVRIDMNNSNPLTSVAYTDDAVGMTGGDVAWDNMNIFKDIKPCILKNGVVQYYLDPNDFTKKADGTPADIESGNDGDVMIEIPKTGFLISTVGNILTVKVTDDSNNPNFKYYAHTRVTEGDRSKLYIGAYLGWKDGSNKLRSLSGKTPTASQTIGTFRTQAKANGSGYDLVSFYPLTLLQCLYLIKYKNLDSQTALGRGYVDGNSAATNTGGTNTKGMDWGETTGKLQMKLFGLEDFWGNLRWWIDGLFSDSNRNIKTAFQNFNDTGSGYTDRGQGATSDISGYMSKPQGFTEAGFVLKEKDGSATTHFCDFATLYASCIAVSGGSWGDGSSAGAFPLSVSYSADNSSAGIAARLFYA